jgi:hypothetical protein
LTGLRGVSVSLETAVLVRMLTMRNWSGGRPWRASQASAVASSRVSMPKQPSGPNSRRGQAKSFSRRKRVDSVSRVKMKAAWSRTGRKRETLGGGEAVEGLAVDAERDAALDAAPEGDEVVNRTVPVETEQAVVHHHARIVEKQVGGIDGLDESGRPALFLVVGVAGDDGERGEAAPEQGGDGVVETVGPDGDVGLGESLVEQAEGAGRVADIADIFVGPAGAEEDAGAEGGGHGRGRVAE